MECQQTKNVRHCTCTYDGCSRKGVCCECVSYHLRTKQLPGCFFPPNAERTYDRSFTHFAQLVNDGKIG